MTIYFLCGTIAGIISGLLPGVGPATILLLGFPFLTDTSVSNIFIFYIALSASAQYYGSVSAIVFGTLGDITSGPAVINGHALFREGRGHEALVSTAIGSFIGSILGVILFVVAFWHIDYIIPLMTGKIRLTLYLLALGLFIIISGKKLPAATAITVGLIIGAIGYNPVIKMEILSKPYGILTSGIPFDVLLLSFVALPVLIRMLFAAQVPHAQTTNMIDTNYRMSRRETLPALRGASVGAILGLVPGVSYTISSNVADQVERWWAKIRRSPPSKLLNLISAESANNAGAITSLIPLVLLAFPVVPSEAIVLSFAEKTGFTSATAAGISQELFYPMTIALIVAIVGNYLMARLAYSALLPYVRASRVIYVAAIALGLSAIWFTGSSGNQIWLVSIVTLIGVVFGLLVKEDSLRLALVFSVFLSPQIVDEVYRQYIIASHF